MNDSIKKILDEMYALDASLQTHEKELEKIINEILSTSPAITIDNAFLEQLRSRLDMRAHELTQTSSVLKSRTFMSFFSRPSIAFGIIIAVLVVLPVLSVLFKSTSQQNEHFVALKPTSQTNLEKNKFGSLALPIQDQQTMGKMSAPTATPSYSGGGNVNVGFGGGGGSAMGMIAPEIGTTEPGMIGRPYEYVSYRFAYKGDVLKLDEPTMTVYKKAIDNTSAQSLAQAIQNIGIATFDLTKLQNTRISYLTLSEDRDRGFVASINLDDNSFSLYANSPVWPPLWKYSPEAKKLGTPSDEEILALADSFIKKYNINLSGYGKGTVIHNQNVYYMTPEPASTDGTTSSIMPIMAPTEMNVLYPLIIDGKEVIDQGGNGMGLNVNVNIPLRAVTGMGSIHSQKYEESAYDIETNMDKILSVAERGGMYGGYGDGGKIITVELETPTLQLMYYSLYNEKEQRSQELYIPAYVFPIKDPSTYLNLYQKYIIVPIVKEILESQNTVPSIKPMIY